MRRNAGLIKTEASLAEFEEVKMKHRAMMDEFHCQRQAEFDRRRTYVTQWLCAPNIQAMHEEITDAIICPSAGSWLVADTRFKKWLDPLFCHDPLLWMTGKPGAGRS